MKTFRIFITTLFVCLVLVSCDNDDFTKSSNATVKVTSVQAASKVGSRYTVKVTVAVSGLASGESVKMIGAKVGTSKSNPTFRNSRSGKKSATMNFNLNSNQKYYIIPFFKTNMTDGEVEGTVKSYRTP